MVLTGPLVLHLPAPPPTHIHTYSSTGSEQREVSGAVWKGWRGLDILILERDHPCIRVTTTLELKK